MQVTVSKLFQRFVAKLSDAPDANLYVQKVQPAEAGSKAAWHTVLINGRYDGTETSGAIGGQWRNNWRNNGSALAAYRKLIWTPTVGVAPADRMRWRGWRRVLFY